MGSSAKKKRDKKKDFKKPKLKVGKARPKPSNTTDTSFKSKSIVLAQQSISTTVPSQSTQFSHHLSLLSSRSSTQRRDSLAYLSTNLSSRPINAPLPQPVSTILPKLYPLILDESNGVRGQLLRLFNALPLRDIEPHIGQLLLYIRAGLTHLAADIRSSATDLLHWMLETCPNEVVSCAGGWVKTLKCLLTILRWPFPEAADASKKAPQKESSWTHSRAPSLQKDGFESKIYVKTLNVLAALLHAGLGSTAQLAYVDQRQWPFPLRRVECHLISKRSSPYVHFNLFGAPRDEEADMYVEREERQRIFYQRFQTAIENGVHSVQREGGEAGRLASGVAKAMVEGMKDFDLDA